MPESDIRGSPNNLRGGGTIFFPLLHEKQLGGCTDEFPKRKCLQSPEIPQIFESRSLTR